MKKKLPSLDSDKAAERFIDTADLAEDRSVRNGRWYASSFSRRRSA